MPPQPLIQAGAVLLRQLGPQPRTAGSGGNAMQAGRAELVQAVEQAVATPQGSPTTLVNGQRQILEGEQAGDLRRGRPRRKPPARWRVRRQREGGSGRRSARPTPGFGAVGAAESVTRMA